MAKPSPAERALERVERSLRRSLPPEFAAAVRNVAAEVRELLAHTAGRPPGSEETWVLGRIATDYLPATVDGLQAMPMADALARRGADGRSPYEVAAAQIALIDRTLQDLRDAMVKGDGDQLAAHGRFLEERFGDGSLRLRAPRN